MTDAAAAAMTQRRPLRVVTLLPSATEIVGLIEQEFLRYAAKQQQSPLAAGAEATSNLPFTLVGRSHECDYPPCYQHLAMLTAARTTTNGDSQQIDDEVRQQLSTNNSLYTLDVERLTELKPDIIITQDLCTVCSIDLNTVRRLARSLQPSPQIVSLNPVCIQDVLNDIDRVGEALQCREDAAAVVAALQRRMDTAEQIAHSVVPAKHINTVFFEWIQPFFPAGHWSIELIERAGAMHKLGHAGQPSVDLPHERVIKLQPDRIIIAPCGFGIDIAQREAEKYLFKESWFQQLPAVVASKPTGSETTQSYIAVVDGNQHFNRSGPRLIDAYEWLVGWIHQRYDVIPRDFPWLLVTLAADGTPTYHTPPTPTKLTADVSRLAIDDKPATKQPSHSSSEAWRSINPAYIPAVDIPYLSPEIEAAHQKAVDAGEETYDDPATGYSVFTKAAHQRRGYCCGSRCRHCPFSQVAVDTSKFGQRTARITQASLLPGRKTKGQIKRNKIDASNIRLISWSGGKDSYLTLLDSLQRYPTHHHILMTVFDRDAGLLALQGLKIDDILDQASHLQLDVLVVPMDAGKFDDAKYNATIADAIVEHLINDTVIKPSIRLLYGDLHLRDMMAWRKRALAPLLAKHGVTMEFPLLRRPYGELWKTLNQFALGDKPFDYVERLGKPLGSHTDAEEKSADPGHNAIDKALLKRYGYQSIAISNINLTPTQQQHNHALELGEVYNTELLSQLSPDIDRFLENGEGHTHVKFK